MSAARALLRESRMTCTRFVMVLALASSACDRAPETSTSTPPVASAPAAASVADAAPSAVDAAKTPGVAEHMKQHFTQGAAMREAVVRGDLEAAKKAAKELAEHEVSKQFPETWAPHVANMRASASEGAAAKTLDAAAIAVGDVAVACGGCHRALGGPKIEVGDPPAPAAGAAAHMARHHWAATKMWEGLVGPADAAWTKGAEVLADAPLLSEGESKEGDPKLDALAKRVHALGERGRNLVDDPKKSPPQAPAVAKQRSAVYGEFLATCATCHQQTGKGPGASPAK